MKTGKSANIGPSKFRFRKQAQSLGGHTTRKRAYARPCQCKQVQTTQLERQAQTTLTSVNSQYDITQTLSSLDFWVDMLAMSHTSVDDEENVVTSTESNENEDSDQFYANLGDAIRTLRQDAPMIFQQDITYGIFRDDIVLQDDIWNNKVEGIKALQRHFFFIRMYGAFFYYSIFLDVKAMWQLSDYCFQMRWSLYGVPRVPQLTKNQVDGLATFKLDRDGKVYAVEITNIRLSNTPFRQQIESIPLLAQIMQKVRPKRVPCPGVWFTPQSNGCSLWDQSYTEDLLDN